MTRKKFKGPFAGIKEQLKYARYIKFYRYPESGIIEMVLDGQAILIAQTIEGMEKSGYIRENTYLTVAPEFIDYLGDFQSDIEDEDDVPEYMCINIRFKDTELPPVENSRKSYLATLRRKTVQRELEAAARDAALRSCEVDTHHHQGDDLNR